MSLQHAIEQHEASKKAILQQVKIDTTRLMFDKHFFDYCELDQVILTCSDFFQ